MLTAQCLLFYYPFKDGRESKPIDSANSKWPSSSGNKRKLQQSDKKTLLKKSKKDGEGLKPELDDDFEEDTFAYVPELDESWDQGSSLHKLHDTSVFSIFWQNRLVPETVVNRLPLFKNIKVSDLDCDKLGIARKWKDRLKGFLFFDWNFHSISNNKLKFTMEPSMEVYLENLVDKELIWTPPNSLNLFEKYVKYYYLVYV